MPLSFQEILRQVETQQSTSFWRLADAHERQVAALNDQLRALRGTASVEATSSETFPPLLVGKFVSLSSQELEEDSDDDDMSEELDSMALQDDAARPFDEDCRSQKPPAMPPVPAPLPGILNEPPVLPIMVESKVEEAEPAECWRRKTLSSAKDIPPLFSMTVPLPCNNGARRPSAVTFEDMPPLAFTLTQSDVPTKEAEASSDDLEETGAANDSLELEHLAAEPLNSRVSRRKSLGVVAGRLVNGNFLGDASILPSEPTSKPRLSMMSGTGKSCDDGLIAKSSTSGGKAIAEGRTTTVAGKPWPLWFELLEAIGDEIVDTPKSKVAAMPKNRIRAVKSKDLHLRETTQSCLAFILQAMVLHPSSPRRLLWMASSMVMILYDIIMIPMGAFDLGIDDFQRVVAWIVAIYWALNLLVSSLMGYNEQQAVELRFRKTVARYAKTWLVPDMALCATDWYILLFLSNHDRNQAGSARAMKSLYIVRALRLLRLFRVARLPSNMREASFLILRSESMSLCGGIVKHVAVILLINHVIACFWYMLGRGKGVINDRDKKGWVEEYMLPDEIWEMQYLTSLHWSLTQFTPASMAVQPQNLEERAFAVAVLLFAMVCFSSFVSSITNLMNHLRSLKSVEAKQFRKLERYLQDNSISFGLSLRVRRYLEHLTCETKKRPQEKDVEMLAKLSEPLRMEIHHEVFSPALVRHPFFAHYADMNMQGMRKLCHKALRGVQLSTDDVLFHSGETAKAMYFVKSGQLVYRRHGRMADSLEEGDWICEMVLWKPWEHAGMVKALTESSLTALDAVAFHTIVRETQTANKINEEDAIAYAFKATERLAEVHQTDLSDLDDPDCYAALDIANEAFQHLADESVAGPRWMGHFLAKHGVRNSGAESDFDFQELRTMSMGSEKMRNSHCRKSECARISVNSARRMSSVHDGLGTHKRPSLDIKARASLESA